LALLDKLHAMTGSGKIAPELPAMERLKGAKELETLAVIGECHGSRNALQNSKGLELTPSERELLAVIGWEVRRCWFQDSTEGSPEQSFGRRGAGELVRAVLQVLRGDGAALAGAAVAPTPCLAAISCHDKTLSALACHLGVELPGIAFAASLTFELHDMAADTGTAPSLRLFYNPDPFAGTAWGAPRVPTFAIAGAGQQIRPWLELPEGGFALAALEQHCQQQGADLSGAAAAAGRAAPKARL